MRGQTFQEGGRQAGAPDSLSPVHRPLCPQPGCLSGLEGLSHLLVINVPVVIPVQCWHSTVVPACRTALLAGLRFSTWQKCFGDAFSLGLTYSSLVGSNRATSCCIVCPVSCCHRRGRCITHRMGPTSNRTLPCSPTGPPHLHPHSHPPHLSEPAPASLHYRSLLPRCGPLSPRPPVAHPSCLRPEGVDHPARTYVPMVTNILSLSFMQAVRLDAHTKRTMLPNQFLQRGVIDEIYQTMSVCCNIKKPVSILALVRGTPVPPGAVTRQQCTE